MSFWSSLTPCIPPPLIWSLYWHSIQKLCTFQKSYLFCKPLSWLQADSLDLGLRTSPLIRYCFAKRLMAKMETALAPSSAFFHRSAFQNQLLSSKPNDEQRYVYTLHFECHFADLNTKKCNQPWVHLQPTGDKRPEEAERGAGKNCSDWIVSDLAGKE